MKARDKQPVLPHTGGWSGTGWGDAKDEQAPRLAQAPALVTIDTRTYLKTILSVNMAQAK